MSRIFLPPEAYGSVATSYELLPFRFTRFTGDQELLVNETGEYLFAPTGTVAKLVDRKIVFGSPLYSSLKAKQFIYDSSSSPNLDLLATKYRTKHAFLDGATKLHIFVVTLRCDHSCHYCQVSRQTASHLEYDMSTSTADRSLVMMMDSPGKDLTLELQGGEAMLAFDMVKYIVGKAQKMASQRQKNLDIVLTTNLANVTDDILAFSKEERIKISTSLDGPAFIHNANRPRPGNNSHELVLRNIERCRDVLGFDQVAALMTTTQLSLKHPIEIIDEYVQQSFHSVFLRPISPYGFAIRTRRKTGYEMRAFLDFYKKGLGHILDINRRGYHLVEVYTKILLTKILTPHGTGFVDLQSPAGAGWNVLVYNYDGDVYVSDESRMLAEMNDFTFRVGNVHKHSRRDILTSEAFLEVQQASCNQSLPGCSDCAYQTYCGSDPIFNHATQGDSFGFRPTSAFCERNMEVIRYLFEMIGNNDPDTMRIFWSWLTDRNVSETAKEMRA
jgi:His-Xaa-Ser system radical SAM maturase HxsB